VSIVGGELDLVLVVRRLRVNVAGFFVIVHILVLKERIELRKIRSVNVDVRRSRKLLLRFHDRQHVVGSNRFSFRQEPSQCVVDQVKAFVFGGMQEFEILLDGGCFGRVAQQLVVCHAESRGGVHLIHVLVVEERPRLPYKRIDYMTKVDRFLTTAELPRHTLEAFILVPEFKMVLMNTYFQIQTDVLAAYRIGISLHANDAVGLHRHRHRSASASSLGRQGIEGDNFFAEPLLSAHIAPCRQLMHEPHEVVNVVEVATLTESQRLVKCILEVTMRRLNVSVLLRLANVNPMAFDTVVFQEFTILSGKLFVA
jgi:hypothetical protein